MSKAIDTERLNWERDPMLNRFSFEFYQKIKTNPMYHMVYSMLRQGVDKHQIIEELLKQNELYVNIITRNKKNQSKYYKVDENNQTE